MATPNPVTKAARKPRARKPATDTDTTDRHARIEAALTRLVNPPALVAASNRTVDGVDYTVALYSDDTVRIACDSEPIATGRFVTKVGPAEYPGVTSIEAQIVDVDPTAVHPDIVASLSNDLTYFAFRAGRFAGGRGA